MARLDNVPYRIKNDGVDFVYQTGVFATVILDLNAGSVVW